MNKVMTLKMVKVKLGDDLILTLNLSKEEALDLIKKLHDWVWAHMRDEKGDMPGVCPICGCCIK